MRSRNRGFFILLLVLVVAPGIPGRVAGAVQEKVPLTHGVYDAWRQIAGETLSDDGTWLLYAEVPQEGDAELVVRNLRGGGEHRQGLGWINAGGGFGVRVEAAFTADSRHAVFLASPEVAAVKKARRDKIKPEEQPKKTLGILDLVSGDVTTIDRVKSFELAADAGGYVAYLLEEPQAAGTEEDGIEHGPAESEPAVATEPEPVEPEPTEPAGQDVGDPEKDRTYGTPLVLRELATGHESRFDATLDYRLTDDGVRLLFTVSSEAAPETDGVYARLTSGGEPVGLLTGTGNYRHLTLDEAQARLAFVTDRDDYAADEPVFALYGAALDDPGATLWVAHHSTPGFPDGYAVSDTEPVRFTDDGGAVMFGIRIRPEPAAEGADGAGDDDAADDADDDDERARFDLWHWDDPYPQPRQLQMADDVNDEAFESVWWIDEGRFVQLADEAIPDVELAATGVVAMGLSDRAWAKRGSYEGFFSDVWLIDPRDGSRSLVAERVSWGATLSDDGRRVVWFGGAGDWVGYDTSGGGGWSDGQHWFLHDVAGGTTRNLTSGIEIPFERQDWDTPNMPAPYGSGGFTEDSEAVLIYDEFDVWAFPTGAGEARRITEGVGRERGTSFRIVRTDPDADGVPLDRPILLASTDTQTMATGFWADVVAGVAPPVPLLQAEARLAFEDLADEGDTFLFSRQTFAEFPDLWAGRLQLGAETADDGDVEYALTDVRKVTDLGAQTEGYRWGNAELRAFRSADGLPLKGILVTPEDFDPQRQYPLMVYIYETLHQGLHNFRHPGPGTSINFSYYVSNGYVLWMPDIEYVTPGYPGRDAMKCVIPGINMLLAEGYIDADAVGIQGHSWGGYQIAYMVSQTDIFNAAEAGAPVSNMTSAYGGIRWASGLVRQFQYERTQSRLGGSLWEVPLRYVENSPLFWADDIDTPLLIVHNDEDGAVPWYQGIELIMALRRLNKEAYMFNYNGEAHGLRQRVNQKDYTVRMQQFFDHHLRGAPAPAWMIEGIRGWDKGEVGSER